MCVDISDLVNVIYFKITISRSWTSKPLDQEVADSFKKLCVEHNFPPHLILPHGSYLLNLGSPEVRVAGAPWRPVPATRG